MEADSPETPVALAATNRPLPIRLAPIEDERAPDGMSCIGSFLARTEMRVFITEWLKRIPDFHIKPGTEPKIATGFSHSTMQLFLEWDPAK